MASEHVDENDFDWEHGGWTAPVNYSPPAGWSLTWRDYGFSEGCSDHNVGTSDLLSNDPDLEDYGSEGSGRVGSDSKMERACQGISCSHSECGESYSADGNSSQCTVSDSRETKPTSMVSEQPVKHAKVGVLMNLLFHTSNTVKRPEDANSRRYGVMSRWH